MGVLAVQRALEEVVPGHGAAHGAGFLLRGRVDDRHGRVAAAVGRQGGRGGVDAGQEAVDRQADADQARGADGHLGGVRAGGPRRALHRRLRVGGALRPRTGVGAPGVEDDGGDPPVREHAPRPADGRGLHPAGGADAGGGPGRAQVHHQRQVGIPGLLDPGGDAAREESPGSSHAHGATPFVDRPSHSGRPRAAFMLCTAPPAVPLVRLSIALTQIRRRASESTATCT